MADLRVARALALYALTLAVILPLGLVFEKSSYNIALFTTMNSLTPKVGGDLFWAWMTSFGDTSVAVVLIWVLMPKNPQALVRLSFAFLLGSILSPLIKHYFDYPRPLAILGDSVLVVGPALLTHGFVSGHTMTAFLVAALVFFGYQNKWIFSVVLVAIVVGVSRIMVGAHWPADVLIGALVGWGAGMMSICFANALPKRAEQFFAWIGMTLVIIAIVYLALGKMANILPVIYFWQGFSVIALILLFPHARKWLLLSYMHMGALRK